MNNLIKIGVMGVVKVVQCFVCDMGYPKTNSYPKEFNFPKVNNEFPKIDIGKIKIPDHLIFR